MRHWHAEHDLRAPAFRVGLVKVAKTEAAFYTDDQVERLLEAAKELGPDAEVLLLLGVDAGLRMSEIRALQWSDLSLRGRATVTVSRTREGSEEYAPKGWKSRVVPLSVRLVETLERLVRSLRDPHVLLDRNSEPLTRRMVAKRFERVKGEAGIEHGSFHSTRHTFCTRLAARGIAPRTIQELAGHADLSTTQRYMHATPGAADAAIAKLAEEVEGGGERGRGSYVMIWIEGGAAHSMRAWLGKNGKRLRRAPEKDGLRVGEGVLDARIGGWRTWRGVAAKPSKSFEPFMLPLDRVCSAT